ncbi:MAG: 50S ribosomal protein L3 [Patescibacteria group bacterium]
MKFIVAKKVNMTEVFGQDGKNYPATILRVPVMAVNLLKTVKKDGYSAVQIGYGDKKKGFKEYRLATDAQAPTVAVGDKIDASIFQTGELVTVSAISKGKGFQGVVKRHGFKGGSRTHGQKHSEREPGAIGGGARAGGRVAKGMRMAGRMGGDRITVKNLPVLKIDTAKSEIYLGGAVPGRRGTLVEIKG